MQDVAPNIIERAYQLAAEELPMEQIKRRLEREGYTSVHEHMNGLQIRAEVIKRRNAARDRRLNLEVNQ